MIQLLLACSIALGVLGITMTVFCLYVIRLNSKLEVRIKEKDAILSKKEEMVEEKTKALKEQEGYVKILREQINVRDRTINLMKRSGKYLTPTDI
jgi:uncharacterized membrane protein YhiD involved in acid resistance